MIFNESEDSSRLRFIKRNCFHIITQIVMICQNRNKMMIVFKIMSLLLKCCNNKQKFLIIHFVFDFSENHFSDIENDRMLLRLIYVDHERYKLKQNCFIDKLWCMDFYFNKFSKIKMNQYERFYKRFNELSKCLFRDFLQDKWFILSFLFIIFNQFRQSTNDSYIESHKIFIKICKF